MSESTVKPPGKKTRLTADRLARTKDTPLDVMIENMLFWRNQAHNLHAILQEKIEMLHPPAGAPDPQQAESDLQKIVAQIEEVGKHFLAARENSQKCAVDAAPYVNARIAPTKLEGSTSAAARLISSADDDQDAMAAYLDSLKIVSIEATPVEDPSPAADEVAS